MDFLDPKEKRKRGIRLAIGYGLMFILIAIATVVLVFQAYGFDLDKRGNVVQNGLVFFDSVPDGAEIFLNGQDQGRQTNVRLSLPEGRYDIELKKDGYLPWANSTELQGGLVERFYYPLLIPQDLSSTSLSQYKRVPKTVLQSPDRRWVLVSKTGSINKFTRFDLNNLGSNKQPASDNVNFPAGLFSSAPGKHKIKLVEWSDDNKNVLVRHIYKGGDEFILLNHDNPAESKNLDVFFSSNIESIKLRDKKYDQYYIYSANKNRLTTADLSGDKPEVFLKGVLNYNPHDDNDLIYTRLSPNNKNTRVILRLGDNQYLIKQIKGKPEVKLNLASYDGDWYPSFTIASQKEAYVYKNPQDIVSRDSEMKPAPITILKLDKKPEALRFSSNASKIMTSQGSEFSVYDLEYDESYRYRIKGLDQSVKPTWMDGHRLLSQKNGKAFIFDFDGKNQHELANNNNSITAMFDRDYARLYTIGSPDKKKSDISLLQTNLRLDADMPSGLF